MITPSMRKWLELVQSNPQMQKSIKYCVYMNRMQKRIDKEMDNLLWLAYHNPKILLDEEKEFRDSTGKVVCHRRLKKLLLTIKALNPKMEVELVLKSLDFPEELSREQSIPNASRCEKCGLPIDLCTCKVIEEEKRRLSMPQ